MTNTKLYEWMQKRAAGSSVGASTIRGMAPKGTGKYIKDYLERVRLDDLTGCTPDEFVRKLNSLTVKLLKALPEDAQKWGMARKCINIFLRNCVYNRHLCEHYRLAPLEPWLEVPLDSHVGKGLIQYMGDEIELPSWPGVSYLTTSVSKRFQAAAQLLAHKEGVSRIHLDDYLYRGAHMAKARAV